MLKVAVFQVDGFPGPHETRVGFELSDDSCVFRTHHTKDRHLDDVIEIFVRTQDGYVDINATITLPAADMEVDETVPQEPVEDGEVVEDVKPVVTAPPSATYTARIYLQEVAEEGEMRLELETQNTGVEVLSAKDPILHVKLSYDKFDLVLMHKMLELEQLQKEFEDIKLAVKQAKKNQSAASSPKPSKSQEDAAASKEKKAKKAKKKSLSPEGKGEEEGSSDVSKAPSVPLTQYVTDAASFALGYTINNRAVILFGAAAVGIFFYGDYASV